MFWVDLCYAYNSGTDGGTLALAVDGDELKVDGNEHPALVC